MVERKEWEIGDDLTKKGGRGGGRRRWSCGSERRPEGEKSWNGVKQEGEETKRVLPLPAVVETFRFERDESDRGKAARRREAGWTNYSRGAGAILQTRTAIL